MGHHFEDYDFAGTGKSITQGTDMTEDKKPRIGQPIRMDIIGTQRTIHLTKTQRTKLQDAADIYRVAADNGYLGDFASFVDDAKNGAVTVGEVKPF